MVLFSSLSREISSLETSIFRILSGHFTQVTKDIVHALGERLGLVGQAVVLAELLDEWADLEEIVARHCREQVMLDLKVKTSREPVHPPARVNIHGGGQLESSKAGLELGRMFAAVMVHEDDVSNTSATDKFRNDDKEYGCSLRRQVVVAEKENPKVMSGNAQPFVLLNFVPGSGLIGLSKDEGLKIPDDLQKDGPRDEVQVLVRDQAASTRYFRHTVEIFFVPAEKREIIKIRVSGHDVRNSMMSVVSILPPVDGEASKDSTTKISHKVVQLSVLKNLLMAVVVAEPSALLVTKTNQ